MPLSDEGRAKIGADAKARWASPEYRNRVAAKISAASKGRVFSKDHREKLGAASKRNWQIPEYRANQSSVENVVKRKVAVVEWVKRLADERALAAAALESSEEYAAICAARKANLAHRENRRAESAVRRVQRARKGV